MKPSLAQRAAASAAPLALALILFAAPANATKYAGEFLKAPVGPRAIGMGAAFTAVTDDATAPYWNPAGMVYLPYREVVAMHAEKFGNLANHGLAALRLAGRRRARRRRGCGRLLRRHRHPVRLLSCPQGGPARSDRSPALRVGRSDEDLLDEDRPADRRGVLRGLPARPAAARRSAAQQGLGLQPRRAPRARARRTHAPGLRLDRDPGRAYPRALPPQARRPGEVHLPHGSARPQRAALLPLPARAHGGAHPDRLHADGRQACLQLSHIMRRYRGVYVTPENIGTIDQIFQEVSLPSVNLLVDGAAIVNQTTLTKCSYGPYSRTMIRICKEELFHERQGFELVAVLAAGTPAQREMAQSAVDRWWWPVLMMFGPPDDASPHSEQLLRWRVKVKSNDELRQWFVDLAVPQVHEIGLAVPDPRLEFDAKTGHWRTGPIDWDEFWRVIRGGGLCNRDRLAAGRRAHEEGRWVREAAEAWAKKRPQ